MIRTLISFVLTLAWTASLSHAAQSAADSDEVLELDHLRTERMMAGAELANLFSADLVFVHSDGRSESKRDYIANLTAGNTAYADVKTSGARSTDLARRHRAHRKGGDAQEARAGLVRDTSAFASVWRQEDGVWRMVAWQSARPAGNSVVPPK